MSNPAKSGPGISLPEGFVFGEVNPTVGTPHEGGLLAAHAVVAAPLPPPLGPLAAFLNNDPANSFAWRGNGFNTIFRPQNPASPTKLPVPQPNSDNILELNLTTEELTFSASLGKVPNRGSEQADIDLNGVPYLQVVTDVNDPTNQPGIHVEPGLWMAVPATTQPPVKDMSLVRMGSIPHGTTIEAQGIPFTVNGGPQIDPVDITPFTTGSNPPALIPFPSQTLATQGTPRLPQDLTSFNKAGTITQPILKDPNQVLRNAILNQTITKTIVIPIATTQPAPKPPAPPSPLIGGGTSNIAFLLGAQTPPPARPNAHAVQMTAIFWIETVEYTLEVPAFTPGSGPLLLQPAQRNPNEVIPTFSVTPPHAIAKPVTIKVTGTQIQYTQNVFLNFKGLTWPHVSVATLVPKAPIVVPPSLFP